MNQFSDLFVQTYWWLSLLGGIHCLGAGFYIRYIYNSTHRSHSLLAGIFLLIGCYFLTGLITQKTVPMPIHLTLTLFIPVYFLLMPMLYLYCKTSLMEQDYQPQLIKHFGSAIVIALITCSAILFRVGIDPQAANTPINSIHELSSINLFAVILPILLMFQAVLYFVAIYGLLTRFRAQYIANRQSTSLDNIRFRWINVLTLGILLNWILRIVLAYLPFYIGDFVSLFSQAVMSLSLLLTVYIFALYGIHQVTRVAYLRGTINASTPPSTVSEQVLDDEELAYLHDLLHDDDDIVKAKTSKSKNKLKRTKTGTN